MKATISKRTTQCSICKEVIPPGQTRLDDILRLSGKFIRLHYHTECYKNKIDSWVVAKSAEIESAKENHHPIYELPSPEKLHRHRLLSRLSSLRKYYLPKLNLQSPIDQLKYDEVMKLHTFSLRYTEILGQLEEVGGLPPHYEHINLGLITQRVQQFLQQSTAA